MGTYTYDLWGKIVYTTATADDSLGITDKNPLRYRGYYYDKETGFYYLNARYYNPEIHRFISPDSVIAGVSSDVAGYNLLGYCDNDPVNKIDTSGNWPELNNKQKVAIGLAVIGVAAVLTIATGGAAAGTVVAAVNCFATGALEGAIIGAATGAASGAAISGGIAFVTSGGDIGQAKQAAIDGACDGFMSGAITGLITGGMTSNHCFVAGTLVETIDGPIPIEQIEEGEFVLSADPETGDVTYKRVIETYVNETTELIHLNVDGEEIVTTPAHPFYVKNIGFVLAGDLEEGTTLVDNEGNELHLLIKRWEQLQSAIPVYNFAVEDYHTYFVGSKNVLVHNACGEQVLESQTSHDNARKVLIDELDKMGAFKNGSKPNIGSLESSYGYGKVIGRKSLDGKVSWRLDYDSVKGVHYNIDSWLNGKGALRIKKAIPIDIPYEEYVKIIDLWN